VIDEKLYPRKQPNESVIREYAKKMKDGIKFPAIYVALFKRISGREELK